MTHTENVECRGKLLILGAGGHGRVVADIALGLCKWRQVAFLDDDTTTRETLGLEVIGRLRDAAAFVTDYDLFIAIGDNAVRERLQVTLTAKGASVATLVHPHAVIGRNVDIGSGTVIMAGVVVNCCSTIGEGCIVNTGATVDHDNVLEDYVHVSPGARTGGTVRIGRGCWIGIGATVSNNVTITDGCVVGAGAVVIKDIPRPGTYIGIPAKRLFGR